MIVVGVDGSEESRAALTWAVAEAQYRQSHLLVVACSTSVVHSGAPRDSAAQGEDHGQIAGTRSMLAAMVDNVAAAFPDVVLRQRVLSGDPGEQLVRLTEHADMCVVGARGHGGLVGMLVGSVSQHVLAHSRCTVVVVR
jgi:nucleotide-binding universal stress UspA family protein